MTAIEIVPHDGRICNTCGVWKSSDFFGPDSTNRTGLNSQCLSCYSDARVARRSSVEAETIRSICSEMSPSEMKRTRHTDELVQVVLCAAWGIDGGHVLESGGAGKPPIWGWPAQYWGGIEGMIPAGYIHSNSARAGSAPSCVIMRSQLDRLQEAFPMYSIVSARVEMVKAGKRRRNTTMVTMMDANGRTGTTAVHNWEHGYDPIASSMATKWLTAKMFDETDKPNHLYAFRVTDSTTKIGHGQGKRFEGTEHYAIEMPKGWAWVFESIIHRTLLQAGLHAPLAKGVFGKRGGESEVFAIDLETAIEIIDSFDGIASIMPRPTTAECNRYRYETARMKGSLHLAQEAASTCLTIDSMMRSTE